MKKKTAVTPAPDALTEGAVAILEETLPEADAHADGFKEVFSPISFPGEAEAIFARVEANLAADREADAQYRMEATGLVDRVTPALGRDVHFLTQRGELRVAKVVDVTANPEAPYEPRVTLAVYVPGDSHLMPVTNVAQGTEPGTWQWPTIL